jgi:hypothetical protein
VQVEFFTMQVDIFAPQVDVPVLTVEVLRV